MYLVDDKYFVLSYLWRYSYLVDEGAYVVYRVVRRGVEFDDVIGALFVERPARFAFVAGFAGFGGVKTVYGFGKDTGTRRFSHAARTAKEVGVSEFFRVDGIFQGLGQCLLPYDRLECRRPVFPCRNDIVLHIGFF